MLNSIIATALRNRLWVILIILSFSVAGTISLRRLAIDAVPDITNVQVMINTKTGALDPEKIEKTVTYAIETEVTGIPGIEEVRSLSKYGLSQVIAVFNEGTDVYWARQQVLERLQNARLPQGLKPELAPITTGLGEIVMYVLEAEPGSELAQKNEKERLIYLRTIQDFVIRPALRKVRGVADVDSNGGYSKQIHINLDVHRMEKVGISIEKLVEKLETVGENYGGGYIQKDKEQIIVRTLGTLDSIDQLKRIPVKLTVYGRPILLQDIADVREDYSLRVGAATYNGKETVLGTVLMLVGANSETVSRESAEALLALKLPPGVSVKILYNRSYLVDATIHTVVRSLSEGAALVVIILLLILGNLRAAVIVALAIPVSMLFATSGMEFLGISANLMSLGAIDFGLLVDASVVIIENILRTLEEKSDKNLTLAEKMDLFYKAATEVVGPVTLGLFIIMAVYVPILSLEGVEGKMFRPMALTVLMALAASLLVAVLLMPVLAYTFLHSSADKKHAHKEPWLFSLISKAYLPVLNFSLKKRMFVLAPALLFFALSMFVFFRMGSDFVPQLDEGDLVINLMRDTRISIDESVEWQKKSELIISRYPEVEEVFSRLGTPESATDPMGVHLADTFVILKKDHSEWPLVNGRVRSKEELFRAMEKDLEQEFPEQDVTANQPIEMRFNEILEGSRADVSLRIYGPDLDKLMVLIDQAEEIIKKIPGAGDVEMDALTALRKSPVLDIALNYDALARYGVDLPEVNRVMEMAMSGHEMGSLYEYDWRFPIVMHIDEKHRNNIQEIAAIPVGLAEGGSIPISTLANIRRAEQVTTIARSWARRYAAISIYLSDRDIASFVAEARSKIERELVLPVGYEVYWGGQFRNLEKARARLAIIVPVTLLVIFILLLKNFSNIPQTLLVYSSIPFALVGGIFALYLRDISFSVSAAVGFIALIGIAILNAMVLVTFFNDLRRQGVPLGEAVFRGAVIRLRPVTMTALVASLGFIPMALNTGIGSEVQRPLATVVIGGLVSSTILTLVLLPTLYYWVENFFEKKKN